MENVEKRVFLFKSPSENRADKYSELLALEGFTTVQVPVLMFTFCNKDTLQSHVEQLQNFSAIIFTSQRAVEAVVNVVGEKDPRVFDINCYVVGHSTALAARKAGFQPTGEEAGNAESLSEIILQNRNQDDQRPMLFPCSNLRRDSIIDVLSKNGVPFSEVKSYETKANEKLPDSLQKSLHNGFPEFSVFFSPSCLHFVHSITESLNFQLDKTKMISLGPSTSKAMRDLGYNVHAEATQPDPKGVLQALLGS